MSHLGKIPQVYRQSGLKGLLRKALLKTVGGSAADAFARLTSPGERYDESPPWAALEEDRTFPADTRALRRFRNIHAGKRCFIIGNGPSLNRCDLSKLKNEITIGVNGIFYKTRESGFRPTYYVVEDSHVLHDNLDDINQYEVGHKFFPADYLQLISKAPNVSFFRMNRGFYERRSPNFRVPRFSTDASHKLYCGQSVTHINLQLAHYMGFTEVYLIGMDFDYVIPKTAVIEGADITSTEDDPNHFHPEYFGKGKKWHDPQIERVGHNYMLDRLVYEASGRKIYNATHGGKLEIFERVAFDSLFP